jgi:hypothetical protein
LEKEEYILLNAGDGFEIPLSFAYDELGVFELLLEG